MEKGGKVEKENFPCVPVSWFQLTDKIDGRWDERFLRNQKWVLGIIYDKEGGHF